MEGELANGLSSPKDDVAFRNNVVNMTKYMRFLGILSIIGGAIYCITIIGAIFGVPAIFVGLRMRESAEHFDKYSILNEYKDLAIAIEKQTKFFFINYVLAIVGIVFAVIYFIFLFTVLGSRF